MTELRGRRTRRRSFVDRNLTAIALIVGAILWQIVGTVWDLAFIPPLSDVLARLVELVTSGTFLPLLVDSLTNLAIGVVIALVLGIGIGLAMGAYPRVHAALDPYVTALNSTPSLIFVPIFFNLFGLSRWSIVALIVLSMSVFLIINTAAAVRGVPIALVEMGRSFNATDRQLFAHVLVPGALPFILGTTRLAAGRGVKAMINGEIFIGVVGLGAIVTRAGAQFDATTVLAVLFVIGAVGFGLLGILSVLESRLTSWQPQIDTQSAVGRSAAIS
jgi:NitT/TauT family transport system permease protein